MSTQVVQGKVGKPWKPVVQHTTLKTITHRVGKQLTPGREQPNCIEVQGTSLTKINSTDLCENVHRLIQTSVLMHYYSLKPTRSTN